MAINWFSISTESEDLQSDLILAIVENPCSHTELETDAEDNLNKHQDVVEFLFLVRTSE